MVFVFGTGGGDDGGIGTIHGRFRKSLQQNKQ